MNFTYDVKFYIFFSNKNILWKKQINCNLNNIREINYLRISCEISQIGFVCTSRIYGCNNKKNGRTDKNMITSADHVGTARTWRLTARARTRRYVDSKTTGCDWPSNHGASLSTDVMKHVQRQCSHIASPAVQVTRKFRYDVLSSAA